MENEETVQNGHKPLRERVRDADDMRSEMVETPAWNDDMGPVTFEVRTMSGKQRAALLQDVRNEETGEVDTEAFYAAVIVHTAFDPETGQLAFMPEDADWLMEKAAGPLEALALTGLRLSGLDKQGAKEAEARFPG